MKTNKFITNINESNVKEIIWLPAFNAMNNVHRGEDEPVSD